MAILFEQFLTEEASAHVRGLILDASDAHGVELDEVQRRFEFNRFEITVDFVEDVARIEDVLEPGSSGETRLPLGEFIHRLPQLRLTAGQ